MKKEILLFHKTDDFLKAQIKENIDDNLLLVVLSQLKEIPQNRTLLVVDNNVITKWVLNNTIDDIYLNIKYPLFIVLRGSDLLTCFFDDYKYFLGRKDDINYLLIN